MWQGGRRELDGSHRDTEVWGGQKRGVGLAKKDMEWD